MSRLRVNPVSEESVSAVAAGVTACRFERIDATGTETCGHNRIIAESKTRQQPQHATATAEGAGADVLIDDRAERPGVKFKDADLIGIPLRLTIGGRGMKEGIVEMKWRAQKDVVKVPIVEVEARVTAAVADARAKAT